MEKITFVNNQPPAINDVNLNQLQTNVENEFTNLTTNGTVNNATKWNNRQDKISQTFSATSGSWIPIIDASGDIEHITIGNIISTNDSGWQQLNSIIQYRKVNNIVYVVCNNGGSVEIPASAYTVIGTLPTGYRPSITIDFASHSYAESSKSLIGRISTTGSIQMYGNVSNSYFGFSVSFPV